MFACGCGLSFTWRFKCFCYNSALKKYKIHKDRNNNSGLFVLLIYFCLCPLPNKHTHYRSTHVVKLHIYPTLDTYVDKGKAVNYHLDMHTKSRFESVLHQNPVLLNRNSHSQYLEVISIHTTHIVAYCIFIFNIKVLKYFFW